MPLITTLPLTIELARSSISPFTVWKIWRKIAKLERLCRYITRPPVSTKRLSMTRNGRVRYELKTPWRNGTTHAIFEPMDFMFRTNGISRAHGCAGATISRLVALIPQPRVNFTRFHGVFAPNSKYRAMVTPARRGKHNKCPGSFLTTARKWFRARFACISWRCSGMDLED